MVFWVFGRPRRRRFGPYGAPPPPPSWYGRRPYGYGYGPPRYGYTRPPAGGSCLRDACLLESGCCLAESLSGNCLLTLLALPGLLPALVRGGSGPAGAGRSGSAASLVAAVRWYQRDVSPRRPGCCRYTPTCSEYAAVALERHGAARGLRLAAGRLLRCRPGSRGGCDLVPD